MLSIVSPDPSTLMSLCDPSAALGVANAGAPTVLLTTASAGAMLLREQCPGGALVLGEAAHWCWQQLTCFPDRAAKFRTVEAEDGGVPEYMEELAGVADTEFQECECLEELGPELLQEGVGATCCLEESDASCLEESDASTLENMRTHMASPSRTRRRSHMGAHVFQGFRRSPSRSHMASPSRTAYLPSLPHTVWQSHVGVGAHMRRPSRSTPSFYPAPSIPIACYGSHSRQWGRRERDR
jgi:hypothetical protein